MNDSSVVLIGKVVSDIRYVQSQDGHGNARFRILVKERRFDRTTNRFVDAEPSFFTVLSWRQLADNVKASVRKGDPVVVSGRLRVREWQADDGSHGAIAEISANSVGHDLARGQSHFDRRSNGGVAGISRAGSDAA